MIAVLAQPETAFGVVLETRGLGAKDVNRIADAAALITDLDITSIMFDGRRALPAASHIRDLGLASVFDGRGLAPDERVTAEELAANGVDVALVTGAVFGLSEGRLLEAGVAPVLAVDSRGIDGGYAKKDSYYQLVRRAVATAPDATARVMVNGSQGAMADLRVGISELAGALPTRDRPAVYIEHPRSLIPDFGVSAVRSIVTVGSPDGLNDAELGANLRNNVEAMLEFAGGTAVEASLSGLL